MKRILYITAQAPWGGGETFVLEEMLAMKEAGAGLVIIPRNPTKEVFHQEAQALLENAVWLPLLNLKMINIFLISLLTKPRLWKVLGSIVRHSRTWRILVKNMAIVPKGLFITELLKKEDIEHIHAHWGSTTATMAYIASQLTGIPWSVTLHRWDITENNMLREKVRTAEFARCISEVGRRETSQIVGSEFAGKIKIIHMGVRVSEKFSRCPQQPRPEFVIACPANLIPVKGHRYLIKACALLRERGIDNFRCLIIGDGPLETQIRQQIAQFQLEKVVNLVGRLPHEELLQMYERGEVDAVVLPSIVTDDGEKEGIPVALMEAMAYKIPVISTETGGIPELISGGAGIMVREKDPEQLADAIERLIKDPELARELGEKGYQKVYEEFNLQENTKALLNIITEAKREKRERIV